MKDKAIELLEKCEIFKGVCIDVEVIDAVLEFGHYVAEEQKKQCLKEAKLQQFEYEIDKPTIESGFYSKAGNWININENSILNSTNVCEQ